VSASAACLSMSKTPYGKRPNAPALELPDIPSGWPRVSHVNSSGSNKTLFLYIRLHFKVKPINAPNSHLL
jgi:hypothetical protein